MTPGRRWWLGVALLLSVGVNLGLLAAVAGDWWRGHGHFGEGGVAMPMDGPHHGDPHHDNAHHGDPSAAPPAAGGDLATGWRPGEEGMSTQPSEEELRRHMPPLGRMADHLGLEGEKRDRFLRLQREVFVRMARSRVERRALTRQLYVELAAPQPDRERVDELLQELSRLYSETERLTATGILESRALLDEEEQRRYMEVLRRLHRHGDRVGPGGGPRPGRRHHRP